MGFVRESFGRVHTESRRESFYISVHYNKDGCCGDKPGDPLPTLYAEVEYADLEDMFQALLDLRNCDPRYRDWRAAQKRSTSKNHESCDLRWGCGRDGCYGQIGAEADAQKVHQEGSS
jgi:hypothetical protein